MQIKIVPGCKYNPQVGIGFVNYAGLEYHHALTLAMIINTCFDNIADPFFLRIKKQHAELQDCLVPSVCDFGSLLAATVSKEEGIRIYLDLPWFSKNDFDSISLTAALVLNQSCWEFVKRYNNNESWIFPIKFYSSEDLWMDFGSKDQNFHPSWLTPDARGSLRHIDLCVPDLKVKKDLSLKDFLAEAERFTIKESALRVLEL